MLIIGLTGMIWAWKWTIVDYLIQKWFVHYSVRSFLISKLQEIWMDINRENMAKIWNELRSKYWSAYIIEQLYEIALKASKNCVIESIRTVWEIQSLRSRENFKLIAVNAEVKKRYQRILDRKSITDNISFEQFLLDEERESFSDDPNKQNLTSCIKMADIVLDNDWSVDELYSKIDEKVLS